MTSYTVEVKERYQFTIEADSREEAEEFALGEPVNELEEYVKVEEDYDD